MVTAIVLKGDKRRKVQDSAIGDVNRCMRENMCLTTIYSAKLTEHGQGRRIA